MGMNAHNNFCLLIACAAVALLAGCASVSSRSVIPGVIAGQRVDTHTRDNDGLTYYLPMRYAEASFRREHVDKDKAEAGYKAAVAAEAAAKNDSAAAAGALKQAEARAKAMRTSGLPATAETYQTVILAEIDARLKNDAASAAYQSAQTKLAAAQAAFDVARNQGGQCGYVDSFSFTLQKSMPDPRAKYVLRMSHSWLRNDEWKFKTTPQGLLSTVDSVNDDQTAQILVALAQGYASISGGGVNIAAEKNTPRSFKFADQPRDLCDDYAWKPVSVKLLIDPANDGELDGFADQVNKVARVECTKGQDCPPIDIQYALAPKALPGDGQPRPDIAISQDSKGIFYRRELPLRVQVTRSDNLSSMINAGSTRLGIDYLKLVRGVAADKKRPAASGNQAGDALSLVELQAPFVEARRRFLEAASSPGDSRDVGSFLMLLPNHAHTDHLPLPAGGFVKTEHGVEFDQGMLVSVSSKRPSEVLRIASTPWEIARATMGVLGEVVQFKVDYASQDAALIEQQTLQLEAQDALDRARSKESDSP
jgi:hypothetical protein